MFLKGKTALVTGGGGGIGWGIAREFALEGARVIVTDINEVTGKEVLLELNKISKGHIFVNLDVREINNFPAILKKIGDVDILINNAGINTPNGVLNMTTDKWDTVFNTNLKGHFFLSQLIAGYFITKKKKGVILFISSVHQDVVQGTPHYSSSKAAIKMLIKEMAVELAPHNIRVVGIAPGGIHISEKIENPANALKEKTVLLGGKNGIPRDIGRAAVFLCSEYWSRHITGETLVVSGGQYLDPRILQQ